MSAHTLERAPVGGLVSPPRVNLLPPEILVRRRLRRVQVQLGGAGVVAILLVLALFVLALSSVSSANTELDSARTEHATLQKQVDGYVHVRQTYALVDQAHGLLRDAGGNEILWSTYLGDLGPLLPTGAWLTKVTVAPAVLTGSAVPIAGSPALAQITFEGTALAQVNVASWLDSIAKERGWSNAYFSRSEEKLVGARKTFNFTSTVTVNAAALSGRHTTPAGG